MFYGGIDMLDKNKKFIIVFVCMNLIYLGFIIGNKLFDRAYGEKPVISFNSDIITVSVKDKEDILLQGVSAKDKEDGNISDGVFIYGISAFDNSNTRTITYAVFDSDNQMVTSSRKMKYKDYVAPRFSATQPLSNLSLGTMMNSNNKQDTSYIHARSSVDGDISNKISVSQVEDGTNMIYKYSVTDSTGTSSSFEVSEKLNLNSILNNNIDIELKKYIVYVKKGTVLNTRSYIKNVVTGLGKQNELKASVDIETNYNPSLEGVYEVRYTLNRSNGDYGVTKLIVIVE